jgi:hypothetical protein
MSEPTDPQLPHGSSAGASRARQPGHAVRHENPTTQQMRIIGQRRAEAEEKLAQHLEQARHQVPEDHPTGKAAADHD